MAIRPAGTSLAETGSVVRLLHTSDWHLGRSLHGADLSGAQEAFLDHLVEVVRSESVDVVAIAGDVYDRAIPPVQSVRLLEDALHRIRSAGAQVVIISGNHDSPVRLGFGAALLDNAGVHLRTSPAHVSTPVVINGVAFYAIPYLEPQSARVVLADKEEVTGTHAAVASRAMELVRTDVAARGLPSVVLAHGWVAGGSGCDSERSIEINGVGTVPASLFDGIDYVALGHLHGQQALAEHLRYSGSPLAYSFSEAPHTKGSWLAEIGADGLHSVRAINAPVMRPLVVLTGTVDELLRSSEYAQHEWSYVSVIATDADRPVDAMDRLRGRFPHVLTFSWRPPAAERDARTYGERVRGRSDLELALDFVSHVRSKATPPERELLAEAFTAGMLTAEDAMMREALLDWRDEDELLEAAYPKASQLMLDHDDETDVA